MTLKNRGLDVNLITYLLVLRGSHVTFEKNNKENPQVIIKRFE
jgi:hypothetical protein